MLAAAAAACSGAGTSAPGSGRPVVAVSVLPQAYFVDRLARGAADVEVMIPPGGSPHTYEPTVHQMKALARARLYLSVGHPHFAFEQVWLEGLVGSGDLRIVPIGAGVPCRDEDDPHVWVSPAAARVVARNVADALVEILPDRRDAIAAELASFLVEIDAVDAEIRAVLRQRHRSTFVVFHPAWGCFAADYGLEQLAIEDEGKEPTAGRLALLIERARAQGVRTVLVQPQFSRESAEIIARELGAEVRTVDPLARDWPTMMRSLAQAVAS